MEELLVTVSVRSGSRYGGVELYAERRRLIRVQGEREGASRDGKAGPGHGGCADRDRRGPGRGQDQRLCCGEFKFTLPKATLVALMLSVGTPASSCSAKVCVTLLALAVRVTV